MIGDTHLVAQARKVLNDLKEAEGFNRVGKGKLLYLLEHFEVFIGACHYSWCFTTQIRGGLANLLSTKWRLPNYMYILFSNDQIEEADILKDEVYKVLEGLFTFINRAIISRKADLPTKSRRSDPPKITVVKTVAKSTEQLKIDNFKYRRRTLNRAIQKVASTFKWRSINIDSVVPDIASNFDQTGHNLSDEGMKLLWTFISDDVQMLNQANQGTIGNNVKTKTTHYGPRTTFDRSYP